MTATAIENTVGVTMTTMTALSEGMGPRVGIGALLQVAIPLDAHDMTMTTTAGKMIDFIVIETAIASAIENIDGIAIAAIDIAMTSTAVHDTRPIHLGMTATVTAIETLAAAVGMIQDDDPTDLLESACI